MPLSRENSSDSATLPPPPYEARQRTPTTLTMRAILDEGAELPPTVTPQPGETFEVLFYRGVDAYLAGDYAQARECFERAQPLEVGTTMCRNNLGILRKLLEPVRAK